jgi:hypothetical protein
MQATNVELAAVFDDATGERVGEVLRGHEDHVSVRSHIDALRPGHRYVQIHTHPASGSLSDVDLTLLLGNPPLRTMVVVGQDGTWYFVSKLRGEPTTDPEEAYDEWGALFEALYPRYQAAVEVGTLTEAEALRVMTNEILTTLAPALRLRYDRLESR